MIIVALSRFNKVLACYTLAAIIAQEIHPAKMH